MTAETTPSAASSAPLPPRDELRARHVAFVAARIRSERAKAEWRANLEAGYDALLAAPLGDLVAPDVLEALVDDLVARKAVADALHPLLVYYSLVPYQEGPTLLFLLLGAGALLAGRDGRAGFFLGLACLCRYEAWIAALRGGRTFVTNGPLLFLTVNGQGPGATVRGADPLKVEVRAVSRVPFERVEIVLNGAVVAEQSAVNRREAASTPSRSMVPRKGPC